MKKIFAILVALMIASAPMTSFAAQNTDGLEKALSIVKQRLDIGDEYDEFTNDSYAENGDTVYRFSWCDSKNSKSVNANITENGTITNYDCYEPEVNEDNHPEFSDEKRIKARNAAETFLKTVNPQYADNFVLEQKEEPLSLWDFGRFSFNISIKMNGLPIRKMGGHIAYSSSLEKITSFYIDAASLDAKIDFPDSSKIISREKAIEAYKDKLGLKLVYRMYADNNDSLKVYAAYNEATKKIGYIDALTGEAYYPENTSEYPFKNGERLNSSSTEDEGASAAKAYDFSEIEKSEINEVAGLITAEDAEKVIRNNTIINLPANAELQSIHLSRNYYESKKYAYSMTFYEPNDKNLDSERIKLMVASGDTKEMTAVYAVVDAVDSNISLFYKYGKNVKEASENKISVQKARETADNARSSLGGDLYKNYKLSSDETDENYRFVYTRDVDGIPFISNTATVEINPADGTVNSWSSACSNVDFPSVGNAISIDEATDKLFEQVKYEPVYMPVYDENSGTVKSMRLVYCFTDDRFINISADNGTLISYDSTPQTENKVIKYNDISGHYAEKAINMLAKYGIAISGTDKFNPDDEIKQKDLLALVLMGFDRFENLGTDTEEDVKFIYDMAIQYGYISADDKMPDEYLSRLDASVIIVRAMGYNDLAKLDEMYNCPFTDVKTNKGYVSILYYLGVINGVSNVNFYPDTQMTRAEAAMTIYNYLSMDK